MSNNGLQQDNNSYDEEALNALINYIEQEQIDSFKKTFQKQFSSSSTDLFPSVIDQVFCSFVDLMKGEGNELYGMLYVTSTSLAFNGQKKQSSMSVKRWTLNWEDVDQFRVLVRSQEMLLYMFVKKDHAGVTTSHPYLFTITNQVEGSLFIKEMSTTEEEMARVEEASNDFSDDAASVNLQDININYVRNMRWRLLIYNISKVFRYRSRTTQTILNEFVIRMEEEVPEDVEQKRTFIYNLKLFKSIKAMVIETQEFNSEKGELEETTSVASTIKSELSESSSKKEDEQEERVNKTNAPSIIIKDYFEVSSTEDEDVNTETGTAMDEMSEVPDTMTHTGSTSSSFSFKRLFQTDKSFMPPSNPQKNTLLEYPNLLLSKKYLLSMSMKFIPAILRIEEDKTTKQITIAIYRPQSRTGRLLDKNVHNLSDMKRIDLLHEGVNGSLLSIELANPDSDQVDTWIFDQPPDHNHPSKSFDQVVKEIRALYYAKYLK